MSQDLKKAARRLTYHQRLALDLIRRGDSQIQGQGVGERTVRFLVADGLVVEQSFGSVSLSDRGQKLHQVLDELGWIPPRRG